MRISYFTCFLEITLSDIFVYGNNDIFVYGNNYGNKSPWLIHENQATVMGDQVGRTAQPKL